MNGHSDKQSMKAVYLSGLLFPGVGQFYLKTYIRGLLFSIIAAIGFYIIMSATWELMFAIANDIEQGKQRLDINSIVLVVRESLNVYQEPTILTAKIAFIASWLISTLDAYLTTKKTYSV